jgi:hypothetical protein
MSKRLLICSMSSAATRSTLGVVALLLGVLPESALAQQTKWVWCAHEGDACSFPGSRPIRYGANDSFVQRTASGQIECTNAAFGQDPVPTVWKGCWYEDTAWVFCAYESGRCEFSGSRRIRYGANDRFVERTFSDGAACTTAAFGSDPISGVYKGCWYADPQPPTPTQTRWNWCANEAGRCEFIGSREVRYGGNESYLQRTASDGTNCTTEVFGQDPSPGVYKGCWYAEANRHPSKLNVYAGTDVDAILQFEGWLGRRVDGVLGFIGDRDWDDFDGSVEWAMDEWRQLDRPVYWSVPLIPNGGATLEQAATGAYDDRYRRAAEAFAAFRPQDAEINIRVGWEFNGDWFPWKAAGKPQAFIGAFQRFVTIFRDVSSRFVFEWNVNIADGGMNPETAYPGDDYVDIIGMDFYWFKQQDPRDPLEAWNTMLSRQYGLQWHQDFASAHDKPTAYSEWGVQLDEASAYIQRASAWFERHGVAFHTYWNDNAAFEGKLSDDDHYPRAAATYRASFGVNR